MFIYKAYENVYKLKLDNYLMAKCPHCNGEVSFKTIIEEKRGKGFLKQETMYSCPHCHAILGFSRGKFTS